MKKEYKSLWSKKELEENELHNLLDNAIENVGGW